MCVILCFFKLYMLLALLITTQLVDSIILKPHETFALTIVRHANTDPFWSFLSDSANEQWLEFNKWTRDWNFFHSTKSCLLVKLFFQATIKLTGNYGRKKRLDITWDVQIKTINFSLITTDFIWFANNWRQTSTRIPKFLLLISSCTHIQLHSSTITIEQFQLATETKRNNTW